MAATFRVLARGDLVVLDAAYARASGGHLRFVGRTLSRVYKREDVPEGAVARERDPVHPDDQFHIECWTKNPEPTVLLADGEFGSYFRARIQEGGLWPADETTAKACGVAFDPKFGGDYVVEKSAPKSAKAGA